MSTLVDDDRTTTPLSGPQINGIAIVNSILCGLYRLAGISGRTEEALAKVHRTSPIIHVSPPFLVRVGTAIRGVITCDIDDIILVSIGKHVSDARECTPDTVSKPITHVKV